ncbi:acetyl-CoA acetyltransferase [Streptosporangium album]|uniref:Acetyl-CoA acetyltransferase n=1 Tax=Streptosporangium album TaxID=47479 RepID=A0A7W7S7B4_9ACTN|nr:thiolase [Streptosporangium album]MBB4944171.1 acetyl-CoA acetyltransferase [Streptosporangium album]
MSLRDKYCIVGVGETAYTRGSGRSTRSMGVEAIRNAMTDAGLGAEDVDGMLCYQVGDSTLSQTLATDLGIRLNFYTDTYGGGSSTETIIGLAIGAIEAGMCHTVAVFRSMNGYSALRMGGAPASGNPPPAKVNGSDLDSAPYGVSSPAQRFQFTFARHMYTYGTTSEQLANVKAVHSKHASNNPRAYYRKRVTVDDVMNSRWVVKPACHLLDCCIETDNATCVIVTSADRARNLRQRPVHVMSVAGRVNKPFQDPLAHYQCDPITRQAGYYAGRVAFRNAGVEPSDIQLTGCYDAFTFTPVLLFEGYGFCKEGEGGEYVSSGIIELSGARPNNTSGGQLCEGYTHGMNLVIENVRQLRHQADDFCPGWREGVHTHDYAEGGCRQVKDVEIAMNMGWGTPAVSSALILRR